MLSKKNVRQRTTLGLSLLYKKQRLLWSVSTTTGWPNSAGGGALRGGWRKGLLRIGLRLFDFLAKCTLLKHILAMPSEMACFIFRIQ
jgi:hypothetical protein